jgi:hypothetical protein
MLAEMFDFENSLSLNTNVIINQTDWSSSIRTGGRRQSVSARVITASPRINDCGPFLGVSSAP